MEQLVFILTLTKLINMGCL